MVVDRTLATGVALENSGGIWEGSGDMSLRPYFCGRTSEQVFSEYARGGGRDLL